MLDFQIPDILMLVRCRGPIFIVVPNFIKIGHTSAKIW